MICVPVTGPDNDAALDQIERARPLADVIEFRLDLIREADIPRLMGASKRPVIATCRPKNCGGEYVGGEGVRLSMLKQAAAAGAQYVDIEFKAAPRLGDIGDTTLIVSHHDFERTPAGLPEIYKKIAVMEPGIIKIVTYANDISDNLAVFNLLKNAKLPTIAFCMGEKGTPGRILCRKFGSAMTYASLSENTATAPGQLTAQEVRNIYNFASIGPETRVYGLIGEDVSQSLSHTYHNLAFRKMNWPGVYVKFPVRDVAKFLQDFGGLVDGLSVTRPHKETILPLLEDTSPIAKRIGSINTVTKIDGRLLGDNVDRIGAVEAIEAVAEITGRTALIMGAGGTAKAVAYGLKGAGAHIIVVNRTLSRAERLAKEVGGAARNFDYLKSTDYDILVNATPVGSDPAGNETLVPRQCLRENLLVLDVVYPHTTQLLRDARAAGCKTVDGLAMFVSQAYEQLKIWLPPEDRRAVERKGLEKEFYNLIGVHRGKPG